MDWRRTEALAAIGAKAPSEFARLEAIPPDDSEILGGPSGIRTQDRRIKSQWLQLQDSTENARKTHENARNCRSQQETAGTNAVSAHLPDTKYDKYDAYEGVQTQVSGQKSTYMLIWPPFGL